MANITSNTIISVKNLSKFFAIKKGFFSKEFGKIYAVDDVSFDLKRETSLGIVGESGSGKTTAGKCINRLLKPTEGSIIYEGREISRLGRDSIRSLRKEIQMIFQDPYSSLDPRMTVEKIVGEGLCIHNIAKGKDKKDRIEAILKRVGISPENLSKYPHQFSGGQRQRIGLARSLVLRPSVLIADEPVSALDVSIQAQVINLLMDLQEEYKLSYIIISHDLSVVKHMCQCIAVMYLGKIVEIADKNSLYESPIHPYSKSLLSAIPIPDPDKKRNRILLKGDIPSPSNPPAGCYFNTRCPDQTDIQCKQVMPQLREVRPGHYVACHKELKK